MTTEAADSEAPRVSRTAKVSRYLYTTSSVAVCRQIGHAGIRLQRARVQADYRALPTVSVVQAICLVAQSRQAIERIQQHGYQP